MTKQIRTKQERIIEAVRQGLEGEAAVEFIHGCGYAMTVAGIARHLRAMGGRGRILERINEGWSNLEILEECFPGDDLSELPADLPTQGELFSVDGAAPHTLTPIRTELPPFETTKVTLRMPTDLYEAVGLAARAEGRKRNDLIVDILTSALSRLPVPPSDHAEQSAVGE